MTTIDVTKDRCYMIAQGYSDLWKNMMPDMFGFDALYGDISMMTQNFLSSLTSSTTNETEMVIEWQRSTSNLQ